jgi:N-glycosylase/DNA lyase
MGFEIMSHGHADTREEPTMPDPSVFRLSEHRRGGVPCLVVHDAGDLSPRGFDAALTFESGQCFRWRPAPAAGQEQRYAGVARGHRAAVSASRGGRDIEIENAVPGDFAAFWHNYLDLGTDYAQVIPEVAQDEYMRRVVAYAGGARLLRQDFEETLFSFLLSSQNNIVRVMHLVDDLCARFGDPISHPQPSGDDNAPVFAFPTASALAAGLCTDPARACGFGRDTESGICARAFAGYRCPYVARTAEALASGGFRPDMRLMTTATADEARAHLKVLPGVGDKVADCVLLYSGQRTDVCPVDTWVARVVREEYLGQDAGKRAIMDFVARTFGSYAGYAQFWFFIYARKNRG